MTAPDVTIRQSTGEMKFPFHVFKSLKAEAIEKSLIPSKLHISRRQRRIRNGKIKED